MPPRQPSNEDLEWESLLRSGRLRAEFFSLRAQVAQFKAERDQARQELRDLRDARNQPLAAQLTRVARETRAASPAPVVQEIVVPLPAPTPVKQEESAQDDTAQRFSLLELD